MRWSLLLLCLLLVATHATATVPPLPPGGLEYGYNQNGALVLSWAEAENTGDAPLAEYHIYHTQDGSKFPPTSRSSTETSYTWGDLVEGSAYTFWITAVNTAGDESAPSVPIVLVGGTEYPHCTVLPIYTNPPQVPEPAVGCLLPPPV